MTDLEYYNRVDRTVNKTTHELAVHYLSPFWLMIRRGVPGEEVRNGLWISQYEHL